MGHYFLDLLTYSNYTALIVVAAVLLLLCWLCLCLTLAFSWFGLRRRRRRMIVLARSLARSLVPTYLCRYVLISSGKQDWTSKAVFLYWKTLKCPIWQTRVLRTVETYCIVHTSKHARKLFVKSIAHHFRFNITKYSYDGHVQSIQSSKKVTNPKTHANKWNLKKYGKQGTDSLAEIVRYFSSTQWAFTFPCRYLDDSTTFFFFSSFFLFVWPSFSQLQPVQPASQPTNQQEPPPPLPPPPSKLAAYTRNPQQARKALPTDRQTMQASKQAASSS